jgi:hypothetical protein
MKPSSMMNKIIEVQRQKTLKISESIDQANEGSPARHVDSMWEAGNKKSPLQNGLNNMLIISYLT